MCKYCNSGGRGLGTMELLTPWTGGPAHIYIKSFIFDFQVDITEKAS